jgi:hypothetical protein
MPQLSSTLLSAAHVISPLPTKAATPTAPTLRVLPLTRHPPPCGPQDGDKAIKLVGYNCLQILKDFRIRIIVCFTLSTLLVTAGITLFEVIPSSKEVANRHPAYKWVPGPGAELPCPTCIALGKPKMHAPGRLQVRLLLRLRADDLAGSHRAD